MKKLLLLLVAAFFIMGAHAQNATARVQVDAQLKVLESEYQRANSTMQNNASNYTNDYKASGR